MEIQIILTSYLLTFMYGDRAFQDPLLLSREIIKKAYHEGLYFITNEKNINYILTNGAWPQHNIFVFAGIPSFQEVCIDLSPSDKLIALKINLSYEELAKFIYEEKREKKLVGYQIDLRDAQMEKVFLRLSIHNKMLEYEIDDMSKIKKFNEEDNKAIINQFHKEIESYHYTILNKIRFLHDSLVHFLKLPSSNEVLNDDKRLKKIAEHYEELCGALCDR